jgi:hypothetical protein
VRKKVKVARGGAKLPGALEKASLLRGLLRSLDPPLCRGDDRTWAAPGMTKIQRRNASLAISHALESKSRFLYPKAHRLHSYSSGAR